MDVNDLLMDLAEAIARDEATASWCMATYGRNHKVLINFDVRNPPEESDCPCVAIYPVSKTVGREIDDRKHGYEVVCYIHDDSSKLHADSNITEYEGVRRIETFRKKIEDAMADVSMGNAVIESVEIDYETIESFPFLMAGMVLTISEPVIIGSNPLT